MQIVQIELRLSTFLSFRRVNDAATRNSLLATLARFKKHDCSLYIAVARKTFKKSLSSALLVKLHGHGHYSGLEPEGSFNRINFACLDNGRRRGRATARGEFTLH